MTLKLIGDGFSNDTGNERKDLYMMKVRFRFFDQESDKIELYLVKQKILITFYLYADQSFDIPFNKRGYLKRLAKHCERIIAIPVKAYYKTRSWEDDDIEETELEKLCKTGRVKGDAIKVLDDKKD